MKGSFLQELAQARPNPGGGAAAAYGAALGLALLEKVVRIELQRWQQNSSREQGWQKALEGVARISGALARLRDDDVQAYFQLAAARTAGSGPELLAAVRQAVRCPIHIIQQAREALALIAWAGEHCRRHLVSDLLVACEFVGAALQGAYHIASANLPVVKEAAARRLLAQELAKASRPACQLLETVKMELVAREDGFDHCS